MSIEGIGGIPKKKAIPLEKYEEIAAVLKKRTADLPPNAANDNEALAANDNEPEFGSEDLGPTVQEILRRNQG